MTWVPSTFPPPICVRLEKSSLKCHRKTDLGVTDQRDLPWLNVCWVERSSSIISRHNVHSQQLNLKRINNYTPLQPTPIHLSTCPSTQTHINPPEITASHHHSHQSTWRHCNPPKHTPIPLNTLQSIYSHKSHWIHCNPSTHTNPPECRHIHPHTHTSPPIQTHSHASPNTPLHPKRLPLNTLPSTLTQCTHQKQHVCPIQLKQICRCQICHFCQRFLSVLFSLNWWPTLRLITSWSHSSRPTGSVIVQKQLYRVWWMTSFRHLMMVTCLSCHCSTFRQHLTQ